MKKLYSVNQLGASPLSRSNSLFGKNTMALAKHLVVLAVLLLVSSGVWGATKTWTNGNGNNRWTTAQNWSGSSVPVAGDDVIIPAGFNNVTISRVPSISLNSLSIVSTGVVFTATGDRTLTISNSGGVAALSVSGSVTIGDGGGNSIALTLSTVTTPTSISGTLTISSTSSLVLSSNQTLTIIGTLTSNGTFTANNTGSTVIYSGGAQTVVGVAYNNLTLSGSGLKTTNGVTVNGIISMEGTATASAALSYGANATLQYNTATSRTAGVEWLTPFAATGGVIIANTGTITQNAAKVFNLNIPLTINSSASLATNNYQLTLGGDFINSGGTFTAGSSNIIITNTRATQSIAGFTTTGTVSMTKTSGTATFAGNVNAAALTLNGNGGTLNLGAGLTHTVSGTWSRTNGTLNGGSSRLRIGGSVSGTAGTFTANTGTVEWYASGAQTLAGVVYNNLILSGSGAKTTTSVTVNGILSMEGTATASVVPTYGANATLQYKGSALQTTGIEFPATFSGTGGVIVDNANGVNMSGSHTIGGPLTLTNGAFSIGANTLTLNGIVPVCGTLVGGASSNLTIGGGAATANIPSVTLNNLTLNRANGAQLCSGPITVNGTLTLTNGKLTLNDNDLVLGPSGSISITAPSGTKMIETNGIGRLVKQSTTAAGLGILYPVGTGSNYTPVQLSATTGAVAGTASLAVRAVVGRADNTNTTDLGKHWIMETANLSGVSATAAFTYVASEINGNQSDYALRYSTNPVTTWSAPSNPSSGGNTLTSTGSAVIDGVWTAKEVNQTWYTLRSGNWNDPTIWTLDPAGSLEKNETPARYPNTTADNVVIKNGRTVTMNINNVACKNITIEGTLDLASSTGQSFTTINGNGRIRMSANNSWPTGDATHFVTAGQGQGTVEYYGNSFLLSTARTFYNMEVMMTPGQTLTLTSNFALNGNLEVKRGTFRINDAAAAIRTIEVKGNVEVSNGASITTGAGSTIGSYSIGGTMPTSGNYHSIFHQFIVWGNFTNNGTVRFTNLTAPNYSQFANNGAVTVRFKGATNNAAYCNGITDFYNLVVDKGGDQTYLLEVNSTSISNFALFGPNNVGRNEGAPFSASNPEVRKALWVANGTLKLTGDISIPTLSEGAFSGGNGDYAIGNTACLWIASSNVSVYSTASAAGQIPVGAAGLDTGTSNQAMSVFGKFRISAGTFGTRNSAGFIFWSSPNAVIMIEGGTCDVAQFRAASSGSGQTSYIQSGGLLKVRGSVTEAGEVTNGYPIFGFDSAEGIFTMSGGEILINAESGNANDIYLPIANGNFNVSGGKLTISVNGGTTVDYNSTVPFYNVEINSRNAANTAVLALNSPLVALKDLIVGNNSTLTSNNNNVSIGGDFTVGATSSTYSAGTNTTAFIGAQNSIITNGSALSLYKLDLAKSAHVTSGQYYTLSMNGVSTVAVSNNLTVTLGRLDTKAVSPNVGGNIEIVDGAISNTTGSLVLNGAALQTLKGNGFSFGAITLNNGNNGLQLLSDVVLSNLVFNGAGSAKVNIGVYNLTLNGTITNSAATRYIYGAGNASDGGVTMYIGDNGAKTYPIGIATKYTPAVMTVSGYSDDGYVTIIPVNTGLATTNPLGGILMPYYWKTNHSGFTTLPSVIYTFTFTETYDAGYYPGKVLDETPYTRSYINNTAKVTNAPKSIIFDTPFTLEKANYTAGAANRFTGTVATFYSNSWYGNWNNGDIWHQGSKTGPTGTVPTVGSIVYIFRDGPGEGRVYGNVIPNIPAEVIFQHNYTVYPVPDGENVPRLQFNTTGTFNIGRVSGTGMISFEANTAVALSGDFGDFGTNPESFYLYYGGAAGGNTLTTIPTPIPNLMLEGNAKNIDQALTINSDLIVQGATTVTPYRNITIGRDLLIGLWEGGTFRFRGSGTPTTITVGRNVDFTKDPASSLGTRTIICETTGNDISHRLIVKGNIIHGTQNTSTFDLYNGATNRNRVVLELAGTGNHSYSRSSTSVPDFYQIVVNKGNNQANSFTFDQHFTIYEGANNGATKSITMQNGALVLNSTGFVNLNLTSGGAYFGIPSTAALDLKLGSYIANGTSGIDLDGMLQISGGTLNMAGADNPIVYGASGSSAINVSAGTLTVGGQVRRSANSELGVLKYSQSGGNVYLGRSITSVTTRGTLEVFGVGSEFNVTGGSLYIERASSASVPGLYLMPASYNLAIGNTIYIGSATVGSQTVGIYSSIPLQNLEVLNSASANMLTVPLTLNGNLTISSGTFNANGLALNINGNFVNNAAFIHGNNTVTFAGSSNQNISGSTATEFYNLTKSGAAVLNTLTGSTVKNNLNILSGTLADNGNSLTVNGNVSIDGVHAYGGSGQGIYMSGSTNPQTLTGNGSFGMLTIDNTKGVYVPIGNLLTISDRLRLNAGVFNIDKNLLTLGVDCAIDGNTFSPMNMIQTNISFTDNGVKKIFPSGASGTFVFPVGSNGKYTPVTFNVTGNGSSTGSIRVKPAAEYHPSIQEDSEAPFTEIVDKDNVLQYYWTLIASDIDGFGATATFKYDQDDVKLTNGNLESQYIAARLLSDGSGDWNKYSSLEVDETTNLILFTYTNAKDEDISGDYTAGIDNAIPAKVPQYVSVKDGDWKDATVWDTYPVSGGYVPTTGPRGSIARVNHLVTSYDNGISSYSTIINGPNGNLVTNATYGHRLGIVSGTGTLTCSVGDLPAADYTDFFSSVGGTLEYNGSSNIDILTDLPVINNLLLSGTGNRKFPNINVQLLGKFTINGPTVDNDTYDKTIGVKGDVTFESGSFVAGNQPAAKVVLNGSSLQTISGASSFTTSSNDFYHFEVNNAAGVLLEKPIDISGNLVLTNGLLTTSSANLLSLTMVGGTASPGSSSAFVNGPMRKMMNSGASFAFPIGKDNRFGSVSVNSVGAGGYWLAEYFNSSADALGYTMSSMAGDVEFVSQGEFWNVLAPAASNAGLTLRWDASSGVDPSETGLIAVQWIPSAWNEVALGTKFGNSSSGYSSTSSALSFNANAGGNYITFGSISIPAYTWVGGTDTDWFKPANWSNSVVPSAGANVTINNVGNNPVVGEGTLAQANNHYHGQRSITDVKPRCPYDCQW
jgi:hypothetical protein